MRPPPHLLIYYIVLPRSAALLLPAEVLLHVPQSYTGAAPAKQAQHTQQGTQHTSDLDTAVLSCEEAYAAELQHQAAIIKHHVPLLVLARSHWRQVLLLFCFEACYGATFYTFFSW